MDWFGMVFTTLLVDAVVLAIVYLIFNGIYSGTDSSKGTSIFSFIVSIIPSIVLFCIKEGPKMTNDGFSTGTVGLIAFLSILLVFPVANLMVSEMLGDDVMQGMGQAMAILGIPMVIVITIMYFSETFIPLAILFGIGALASVITFFKD